MHWKSTFFQLRSSFPHIFLNHSTKTTTHNNGQPGNIFSSLYIHTGKLVQRETEKKVGFQAFTRESFPCAKAPKSILFRLFYSTHTCAYTVLINTCESVARDLHDIFAGSFLATHEARQTQASNNEKGDKEDWQFFLCVVEKVY